jgi:hypothetical protein
MYIAHLMSLKRRCLNALLQINVNQKFSVSL